MQKTKSNGRILDIAFECTGQLLKTRCSRGHSGKIYNGSGKNVTDLGPPLNDLARSCPTLERCALVWVF